VIVDTATERGAVSAQPASWDRWRIHARHLTRELPQGFAKLREALKPLVGDLQRVVYVSYANPTLAYGAPCPGGRAGFDIHPSFNAEPQRLANVSAMCRTNSCRSLKALALCQSGILCRRSAGDRMTFVDAHQVAFADHGFCAGARKPIRNSIGNVFRSRRKLRFRYRHGGQPADALRPQRRRISRLSARARWIRDGNDSYFAAMTYPQGLPSSQQPADIHDPTWGRSFRGVWRRGASKAPKAMPRWRMRLYRPQLRCCSSMHPRAG